MIFFRITAIFILFSILLTISLRAQTAQDYYRKGLELKEQGDIEGAIAALEKATARDHGFAVIEKYRIDPEVYGKN